MLLLAVALPAVYLGSFFVRALADATNWASSRSCKPSAAR